MAGPAKPKAQAIEKPESSPEKAKQRKKPAKTLTLQEATEQLSALNLNGLTEEGRLAAVLEIRARLTEQAHINEPAAQALARRILLLRLWHELVQLRIADVQSERKPPFEPHTPERLFPPVETDSELPVEPTEPAHAAALEEALKPLEVKPFIQPEPSEDEHLVRVKLLETEMVRGMKLPAGITVDVQPEDADHLIEKGKAVRA